MSPGLTRTFRIRSTRKTGGLGLLTTALGDVGASIGDVDTVRIGHNFTIRDFHLLLQDDEQLDAVVEAIALLQGSEILEVIDTAEVIHRGGKIRTVSRVALDDQHSIAAAHIPGVKQVVRRIADDPRLADMFSSVARTVAVVTDGSGVLGLNRVSPMAALPVVETKCAFLAKLAGLSGLALSLDVPNEERLCETLTALRPSYSALLIESVAAPRGQRVAQRVSDKLQVPVFHDGADGPAIVGLAAILGACKKVGRDFATVQVGQIGLGTAGGAISRLVMKHQGRSVLGEDFHPGAVAKHVAHGGVHGTIDEIMSRCDVVIMNTGHPGLVLPSQVREGQIIIALGEPRPEIEPFDAALAGAAFAADGKSISTAAVYPGVLLGALAVKARVLDDAMRIAAALAMVDLAEAADLVPVPLQPGIHAAIAVAVAKAAVASGNAATTIDPSLLTAAVFEEVIADQRLLPLSRS
jgi:malate dehydrogenase (oxaloacetate-decarboxylating)